MKAVKSKTGIARDRNIAFRLTQEEFARLAQRARDHGMPLSEFVRFAIYPTLHPEDKTVLQRLVAIEGHLQRIGIEHRIIDAKLGLLLGGEVDVPKIGGTDENQRRS